MGRLFTTADIKELLDEALARYRDHQAAGDDMVKAGEELADAVDDVWARRPCGIPRSVLLPTKKKRPNPFSNPTQTP